MYPSAWYATRLPSGETATVRSSRTGKVPFTAGEAEACIRPVSTSTPKRTALAALRESFTRNGIVAEVLAATSTRWTFPPAQRTTDLESGVHAIPGYTPWIAQPSCMSCSTPSQTDRSTPDSRSRTKSVDLYLTRRRNASDLPSGDGVGRIEPPAPVT